MVRETLATWRAARATDLILPSGLQVRVRKVQLLDLAAQGQIPTPLYGQVEELIARSAGRAQAPLSMSEFPNHAAVIDLVVAAAVLEPPLAAVADDEHLCLNELPFTDRIAIFNWAQQEAAQVATFPGNAGDGERVGRGRRAVPSASQRAAPAELDGVSDQSDDAAAGNATGPSVIARAS